MARDVGFVSGTIVSSAFLNAMQDIQNGAIWNFQLTEDTDPAKIGAVPRRPDPAGVSFAAMTVTDDTAPPNQEWQILSTTGSPALLSAAAGGGNGQKYIWASAATGDSDITLTVSAMAPVADYVRKVGEATLTGSTLSSIRMINGVYADADQVNNFTFRTIKDAIGEVALTLRGKSAQNSNSSKMLSLGYDIAGTYTETLALAPTGLAIYFPTSTGQQLIKTTYNGESYSRFSLYPNGISMGGGAGVEDVSITRSGTGTMAAVGKFSTGLDISSGQTYKINGVPIATADLSDLANIARLDQTQVFTGANTFNAATVFGAAVTTNAAVTLNVAPKHAVQAFTATGSISGSGGKIVTFVGSAGQTLTLPASAAGLDYTIFNIDTSDSVSIARAGSDTIDGATTLTLSAGECLVISSASTGIWRTSQVNARNSSRAEVFSVAPVQSVQAFTATGSIVATGGKVVSFTGSAAQTLTLPASAAGLDYTIFNIDSSDSVSIARAGSDTIDGATTLTLAAGESLVITSVSSGVWRTSQVNARNSSRADILPVAPVHGIQAFTATGSILATGGKLVTFAGAAAQALTLPASAAGLEYEIYNIDASDSVIISRAGSDTIDGATSYNLLAGERIVVSSVSTGVWRTSTLAAGSVTNSALATASVTNNKLATNALGAWRTVRTVHAILLNADGTTALLANATYVNSGPAFNAGGFNGGASNNAYGIVYLDPADFRGDASRTVQTRLRMNMVDVGNVSSAAKTVAAVLYRVDTFSTTGVNAVTLLASLTLSGPTASGIASDVGLPATLSSAGNYIVVVNASAALGTTLHIGIDIQAREQ